MNLIGGKQTGKEDEVSWGIVSIYLKVEMKKGRVNFDWLITGKNFLGMNCTVCAPHMKNIQVSLFIVLLLLRKHSSVLL